MKIVISPLNSHFKFIDNKYLLGKSDENTDEFDILLFASREIEEISIPSNAKKICEYAFENCNYLTTVEIKADSNLHTIGEEAFSCSSIKEIFVPSKVSKIGKSAFSECQNLTKVEIANNCKLQTIETYTFNNCNNLRKIEIPQNSNLQAIEESAFESSGIEELYFQSSLKELKKGWCNDTRKLAKIIVSPLNSHFKFIDNKYLLGKYRRI
ncbi:hypothetical protein M9Y10_040223 [Tritrichomonas musculus]|uniref:Surface antigen BspA-like protein n=1 Tax=Tritrichomonas musculus TaxID=1915356 RepID=A0ABR2GQ05_9EUKA